jgi:CrcB protein
VSLPVVIAVCLLGGAGAVARFMLDGEVSGRLGRDFPYGTLFVNASGALVLGVLVGLDVGPDTYQVAATGLLGSFTTFSTWVLESHRLAEDGRFRLSALNLGVSLIVGVAAAWLGWQIGVAL